METQILKQEKDLIEVKIDNLTVAEILRSYLNKQGIEFAAWRREHPSKPVILRIQSSGKTAKKEISDAISAIKKDLNNLSSSLKSK